MTTRGHIPHHEKLTQEQRDLVSSWVRDAVKASGVSDRTITWRAKLGSTTLRVWMRGHQTPSQEMLDWLSQVTSYPLPDKVREFGGPRSRFSKRIRQEQEQWASRHQRGAPELINGPVPTINTVPPRSIRRAELANQALEALVLLAEEPTGVDLNYETVSAWLCSVELSEHQRWALMRHITGATA